MKPTRVTFQGGASRLANGQGPDWRRRGLLCSVAACALMQPGLSRAELPTVRSLGTVSLLGNSVRVIARQLDEVMFKDVAMDETATGAAERVVRNRLPAAQLQHFGAPEQVSIDEQLQIGLRASRDGAMPDWMLRAAREAALSHLLLINCNAGTMEFRTAMTQVEGNRRITGIGFYVSADGRTKNLSTGAVSSGYLAPFVHLRLTLLDVEDRRALNSVTVSDGFIVAPPSAEAPDPWRFLDRAQKARALQDLLKTNVARGAEKVLA